MQHRPYHDNEFEMDAVIDDAASLPDSPLTEAVHPQPKWLLQQQQSRFAWLVSQPPWIRYLSTWLTDLIWPRWTWRYMTFASIFLYILICLARSQPFLASRLPEHTGPHDVGAIDLEVPLDKPRRISDVVFKSNGDPAFELSTILLTLYYPVAKGTKETKPRHAWLTRPIALKAEGYAKFAGINNFITRSVITFALWAIAGSITIPAKVDAPLLPPPTEPSPLLITTNISASSSSSSSSFSSSSSDTRFPVMVFSHGDASGRNEYTHFAGELASRGYVIALLEHRDGSGAGTLIKIQGQEDKQVVHFRPPELLSDPPMDRPRWKKEQLAMRDAEIFETIDILRAINDGRGHDLFSRNSRNEGTSLRTWAHRLDLNALTIGGHSFGATSALQVLKHAPSTTLPAVGGIILDPGKSSGPLNAHLDVPILVLHSDSWSRTHSIFHGRPHFDTVRDLVLGVLRRAQAAWFLTSLGTSHPTASDAPLIEPLLLSFVTGSRIDTQAAMGQYVRVAQQFWDLVRKPSLDMIPPTFNGGGGGDGGGGLLAEKITHKEYGKWVSGDRQVEFQKEAHLWQIHVSPASQEDF